MISFLSKQQVQSLVIADDDRDDQSLLKEAIEEVAPGISVEAVFDGTQLMGHLRGLSILPDLVLLDMNMPNKNGLECIKEIRQDKKLHHLPVVFLSTSCDVSDIEKAHANGANLFFSKPNSFACIKNLVQSIMQINWVYFPRIDKISFVRLATDGVEALSAEFTQLH